MNTKSISYPIIFMVALTAITVLLLALLNQTTLARVQENQELDLRRKILYVFDLYEDGVTTDEEVSQIFEERIEENTDSENRIIYTLSENGEPIAHAVPFNGPGLWGSITGYIGVDADMENFTGVEFIEQNETPGLGGRISETPYKEQFRGVPIPEGGNYIVNRPAEGGNIDAVTGATQTSSYVQNMINEDLEQFVEQGGY